MCFVCSPRSTIHVYVQQFGGCVGVLAFVPCSSLFVSLVVLLTAWSLSVVCDVRRHAGRL